MTPAEQPLITVVIATYNRGHTLGAALESLRGQDLPPDKFEVLVVDDGSSDNTMDVLRGYKEMLCVLRQPHLGLPTACNLGLARARGAYFARLDSDDTVTPDWLSRELELLQRHPEASCVYPDYIEVRESGERLLRPARENNLYTLMACGTLFRTAAVRAAGGFRPLYWEEFDLYLRLKAQGEFLHLEKPLYLFRSHPASMTASTERRLEGWRELVQQWGAAPLRAAGAHPDLEKALCRPS